MKRYAFALMTVLLVLLPWRQTVRADPARYTIENLGNAAGLVPTITGINASGQLSGFVNAPEGPRAVRYTDGRGWEPVPGMETAYSQANGINTAGDLAGFHITSAGELRAFRYRDGAGAEDIAPLPGGSFTVAYAINTAGDVVGYGDTTSGIVAFLASPGVPAVALPSLGGSFALACGVNDARQIAGSSANADGVQHAMRIDFGQPPIDIQSFNGATGFSAACAIDADGRVGGQADGVDGTHAFRFDGTLRDLHTPFATTLSATESVAAGVSVGWFSLEDGSTHAFANSDADGSVDLNTVVDGAAGWTLSSAKAVNADGVIVGEGSFGGAPALFRLTRVPSTPEDTTAPAINALSASPNVIVPANEAMVPVTISVSASDDVDPKPVCSIAGIDTHGAPSSAAVVTSTLTGSVRASGRALYSFAVRCVDATGNAATASVDVAVPPDTTAPVFTSLTATPSTIFPPKGQTVAVTVAATATDDSGQAPVCKLASIAGPGTAPADFNVTGPSTGTVRAVGGSVYAFRVLCVDAANNVASASVNVTVPRDTTAPVIGRVSASPSTLWPPNGAIVPVAVSVTATDDVDDAPVCALSSVTSTSTGSGDAAITGPLSASLRATGGRTYTLNLRCSDAAGNSSNAGVAVVVPPDTKAPVIDSIRATPSTIWPPNGKFVPVSVSVSATDNVDANPTCAVVAIAGGVAGDAAITGALTANVRADKNSDGSTRVYTLSVRCSDQAGNSSTGSVCVKVTKDAPAPAVAAKALDKNKKFDVD
jgi:hypothetical protein